MKKPWILAFALASCAQAQFSAPGVGITIKEAPPVVSQLARKILVQPSRLETSIAPGHTTGTLSFTLFSEVPTEVFVKSSDARLVMKNDNGGRISLNAYAEQTVTMVALSAHTGTLTVTNRDGTVLQTVPYIVAAPKAVNQGASLNFSPSSGRVGVGYNVSGVSPSILDPTWSISVNMGVNTKTEDLSGNISINVNW